LCEQPGEDGNSCDICKSCQLFNANNHPDYIELFPEEAEKPIKIDQVRELIQTLSLSRHGSGNRCVIIEPADAMNTASANSLLKTLEEPPAGTLLWLVTSRPSRLPATIRSRCQQIVLHKPEQEMSISWLKQQGMDNEKARFLYQITDGCPITALEISELPVQDWQSQIITDLCSLSNGKKAVTSTATSWLKLDIQWPILWLYQWIQHIIRLKMTHPNNADSRIPKPLQDVLQQVDLSRLFEYSDKILQARNLFNSNANSTMLTESLLIDWVNLTRPGKQSR